MSIQLDELIRYWHGRLSPEREAAVEEAIFEDASTARRLESVVRLDGGIREVMAAGKARSALTVDALEGLKRAGLRVRTYEIAPGETVPCTIALEDLVAVRLRGDFATAERVDVVIDGTLEGMPATSERFDDVPVDRRSGELVFIHPGDQIRALPRSQFRYTVTSGALRLGVFMLDHTPPMALT